MFTSGTQKLQGRTVNHDKEPYVGTSGRRGAEPFVDDGEPAFFDPRLAFDVTDNPILLAYREYPDHSVEAAENWLDTMQYLDGGTDEIAKLIVDAVGTPAGPGWEDPYWDWLIRVNNHTIAVFKRLINLNR